MRRASMGVALVFLMVTSGISAAQALSEYVVVPGDVVKVNVFKNPDLTLELRVSAGGTIAYPLIGTVSIAGITLPEAERKIAGLLKEGGFVLNPQVSILLTQGYGNLVSVIGEVKNPGRYSIEASGGHLSGMLATAGGISDTGADVVIANGTRNGKPFRREIDIVKMSQGETADDIALSGGDTLFVGRAPLFYIYGQVQRPGQVRLERGMTVIQALASGGGVTGKGTSRGIVRHRRDATGKIKEESVAMDDEVKDQDVIYVRESLF